LRGSVDDHTKMAISKNNYLEINRLAYDALAPEYLKRAEVDRVKDVPLVEPFVTYLKEKFRGHCRVLDIGPGNGVNLSMLHEAGFDVAGVDISSEMIKIAKKTCPEADFYLGDFLAVAFPESDFQGVFAKASLHLLPKDDAELSFSKVHKILAPGGMFYISTTAASDSKEGFLSKKDYPGQRIRFRKHWMPVELRGTLIQSGFSIFKESFDFEADWNKRWYNVWAVK